MKRHLYLPILALLFTTHSALAQSSSTALVICHNKSTQKLSVKQSCLTSEVLVSGKNINILTGSTNPKPTATPKPSGTPSSGSGINLVGCYQTTAKRSGSTFDGRVAVGLLCKQSTDVLINEQFTTKDLNGAKPALESKRLVYKGKIPNGLDVGFIATAGANKFYEVQLTATCCPSLVAATSK